MRAEQIDRRWKRLNKMNMSECKLLGDMRKRQTARKRERANEKEEARKQLRDRILERQNK